jgi:hypothetical protein
MTFFAPGVARVFKGEASVEEKRMRASTPRMIEAIAAIEQRRQQVRQQLTTALTESFQLGLNINYGEWLMTEGD